MIPPSYAAARAAFRTALQARGGTPETHALDAKGPPDAEQLSIDVATFAPNMPRAVVFSSGVHGVEGYIGSAVQRAILERGLPDDIRVVFIHAVNPYGMAHHRRVNESNVDINRNFLLPGEAFEGCSDGYRRLSGLINPTRPAPTRDPWFLARAAVEIARHGLPSLRQAFAGGQYEFPTGIFYGGARHEQSASILLAGLPRWLAGAERVVHVDYHVGRGKRGASVIYANAKRGSARFEQLTAQFGPTVEPWETEGSGQGTGYAARGTLPTAFEQLLGVERAVSLTQEVGTLPDLRIAQAFVMENQAHHHGGDRAAAKRRILEAFHPPDEAWQQGALAIGLEVAARAMAAARA